MEYKFRGKRKSNGEWVFGCFVSTSPDEAFILIGVTGHIKRDDYECYMVEVIPETVGMWTGLKDKKGGDIYEGDVIEFVGGTTHYLSCGNYASDDYSIGQILVVRYLKSGFTLSSSDILNCDAPNVVGNVKQYDFWNHQNSLVIIGNIHDAPHLLNPAKGAVTNTMNNFDPNEKQATEEVKAEGQEIAAVESEAQEKAMESAEEGTTEG